jgi:hypothetical protein
MSPLAAEKIAHAVVEQYRALPPERAENFPMLCGLFFALSDLDFGQSFNICANVFKAEYACFETAVKKGGLYPAPLHAPHAGRWQVHFDPELN